MPKRNLPPTNMVVLKPSRAKPQAGDVFLVSMLGKELVVGRVVSTDAMPEWSANLLYFYRMHVASESEVKPPFAANLLIPPQLTNELGWRYGYFKTLYNAPVRKDEVLPRHVFQLSQGPLRMDAEYYVDECRRPTGRPTKSEMPLLNYYGLVSYRYIDDRLSEALGIPSAPDETRGRKDESSSEHDPAQSNGEETECCVTVYVPIEGDVPEDLVDELEERLGQAVRAGDAGKWEGHGTHLVKKMFDTRFVGPDRRRLVIAIRKGLEGFRHRLPAGWYVTSRVGLDGEERHESV